VTIVFPPRLHLAQLPTPIHPLDRFSSFIDSPVRLWIKRDDLTGCAASGNKIRKLEFTLAEAQQQGADVIITCGGVQSNHARATALLGAQLGFKVHLLLRGEAEELKLTGNYLLDHLAGASISCYPSSVYVSQFDQLVEELIFDYRRRGHKPYFITTGASDSTGVWGYIKGVEELHLQMQQINVSFDHLVCACGSGGTLAGLVAGQHIFQLDCQVWGINICDDAAHFEKKSRDDLRSWRKKFKRPENIDEWPIHVIDGYVGRGYGKSDKQVYDTIKQLAALEGIILDPVYTGKAFQGLINEIQQGKFQSAKNILFIHTGGIFGLMADSELEQYL
jgi:D-cysteine desulfhydrase